MPNKWKLSSWCFSYSSDFYIIIKKSFYPLRDMNIHIMQYIIFTNSMTYFNNYSVSKISVNED